MSTDKKYFELRERIANSIAENKLEDTMGVLKLQAAEMGLSEDSLHKFIEELKREYLQEENIKKSVFPYKGKFTAVIVALVVSEWLFGIVFGGLTFSKVVWLLAINVVSIVVAAIVVATIILNKK